METSEPGIDLALISQIIRRRFLAIASVAIGLFVLLSAFFLYMMPQSFASRASIAFQQSTPAGGALAGLLGGGSATTKYIGILRSRNFAEKVERETDLHTLYNLPVEKAVENLQKSLGVDDNVRDGLLYITVTLSGPSRLSPGGGPQRDKVKRKSAEAANAYIKELQDYVVNSDVDKETVLLRAAGNQLEKARNDYQQAIRNMIGFITQKRPRTSVSISSDGSSSGIGEGSQGSGSGKGMNAPVDPLMRQLEALYVERGDLESRIQAAQATLRLSENLRSGQLNNINVIPSEDPLLAQARAAVAAARNDLEALRLKYSDDNPDVYAARKKLSGLEASLQRQMQGIRQGKTTDRVQAEVELKALETKYASVSGQITDVEKKTQVGRELSTELERRRNEVALQLEVLKTTASQTAQLTMQTVSAKSRMSVVDTALPPHVGAPGVSTLLILSFVITVAVLALWIYLAYRGQLRTRPVLQPLSPSV